MSALDRRRRAVAALLALAAASCGLSARERAARDRAAADRLRPGLETHAAAGRPRLVVVRREGDPTAAIAIELRLLGASDDDFPVAAVATLVGARLEAAGFLGVEVGLGARIARIRALASGLGAATAEEIDGALVTPVTAGEPAMAAVRRLVEGWASRPVSDPALARAARCLDRPTRLATWSPPEPSKLVGLLEAARARIVRADAVAVAAVGGGVVDAFAQAFARRPVLPASMPDREGARASTPAEPAVTMGGHEGALLVVEGRARAAIPAALGILSARDGALASRLRAGPDFRVRGVAGAARPEGGCLVVEVEPAAAARASKDPSADRFVSRASVAIEIAREEVDRALAAALRPPLPATLDAVAQTAIGEGGDPRETADRAAWWSWPSTKAEERSREILVVQATSIAKTPATDEGAALAALRGKFAAALSRARLSWAKSELDLRPRVEVGQGELWALLGSPCASAHEGAGDAGLAAVAAAALARTPGEDGVTLEPWASSVGIGLLAHAAPRPGETPTDLARRIGDVLGRRALATIPSNDALAEARGEALSRLPPASTSLLQSAIIAIAPAHPSWIEPNGTLESVARIGGEATELRLASLRAGPIRLAILANDGEPQIDAVARAVERWLPRRPGEARACPIVDPGAIPRGAIVPMVVKSGTGVAVAFPVEERDRDAATALASLLDARSGPAGDALEGVATRWEARVLRGVGVSALVFLALAPDPNVDPVVARVRALFAGLRSGLDAEKLARADRERSSARTFRRLSPRGRIVDLFAGDAPAPPALELAAVRAAAQRILDEDRAQLVVARLSK